MATLRALEQSAAVRKGWPVIARTLRTLSNVRVRNVATVGGALAHADPHMDLPPVLIALGARVVIHGTRASARSRSKSFTPATRDHARAGELITEVRVPALGTRRAAYLKCTTRSADDWPALGVAVVLGDEHAHLRRARAPTGRRGLGGRTAARGRAAVKIEGDLHGSAAYKRQLLSVYLATGDR